MDVIGTPLEPEALTGFDPTVGETKLVFCCLLSLSLEVDNLFEAEVGLAAFKIKVKQVI